MRFLKHKEFFLAYFSIVVVVSLTFSSWRIHKEHPYQFTYDSDVNQYYSYLPQTFILKDPSFSKTNERKYWMVADEGGKPLPRTTMGMAIMYLPGFVSGHIYASISDKYKPDGYSLPYSYSFRSVTYLYVTIALFLLYLSLLYFFKPWLSALSIFLIFLGTNLYYYTLCEGEMSHSYLFLLNAVIILNTLNWFEKFKLKNLFFLSLAFGMTVLIRPTSVIVFLFPLLYGLSKMQFKEHILLFSKGYIIAFMLFILPIFLQLLYWRIAGGSWVRYSYGEERFFFDSPHILDFLFSYRKGWLLYTPIMIFALIGMFWLPKRIPGMKLSIPLIIVLAVYILSSWWSWWFGGSYGSRVMIEFYAFLIFPLTLFIEKIAKTKYIKFVFIALFSFTIFYNILGTHKKTWWQLHWDSMTKEAFWITFSEIDVSGDNKQKLEDAYSAPDEENARQGKLERERPFD